MNWELLKAVKDRGLTQREFARVVGDHESLVSRIITGRYNPEAIRKVRYAKALGKKTEELFTN